jgi:hypothetical protein
MDVPRVRVHEFEEAFDEVITRHFARELTRIAEFRFDVNRRKAYDRFFLWHNDAIGSPYLVVEIDESHHKRDSQITRDYNNMMTSLCAHPIHFLRVRDSDFHNVERVMHRFMNFISIADDDVRLIMLSHAEKYHKLDAHLWTGLREVGARFKRVSYGNHIVYAVKVAQNRAWDGYGFMADGMCVGCYGK